MALNHNEHDEAKQKICVEEERAATWNQEFKTATAQQIETIEVEKTDVFDTILEINQAEQCQSQSLIAKLKQALLEISYQLALRNQELKEVLEAFKSWWSNMSKKQLYERSKTVTAAILALETMSRTLKVSLSLCIPTTLREYYAKVNL